MLTADVPDVLKLQADRMLSLDPNAHRLTAYLRERERSAPPERWTNGPDLLTGCGCFTCLDQPDLGFCNPTQMYMIVCPQCGNKRCPHATHHVHPCTGSNEPGQAGSRYT